MTSLTRDRDYATFVEDERPLLQRCAYLLVGRRERRRRARPGDARRPVRPLAPGARPAARRHAAAVHHRPRRAARLLAPRPLRAGRHAARRARPSTPWSRSSAPCPRGSGWSSSSSGSPACPRSRSPRCSTPRSRRSPTSPGTPARPSSAARPSWPTTPSSPPGSTRPCRPTSARCGATTTCRHGQELVRRRWLRRAGVAAAAFAVLLALVVSQLRPAAQTPVSSPAAVPAGRRSP